MSQNAPKKRLGVLDALNQSLAQISAATSTPQRGPLRKTDLNHSEAGPSSSKKGAASEALRKAQMVQLAAQSEEEDEFSDLENIVVPRGRTPGDFNLNYDSKTPILPIDIGGADQAEKSVINSVMDGQSGRGDPLDSGGHFPGLSPLDIEAESSVIWLQYQLAEFVTKSIENTSNGFTVKQAMTALGLRDQRDLLSGVEVRLLSHQAIGVAWMVGKEKGPDKGGILADDMGLGKTVQMIATMAVNMPDQDDDCRTTLVIVPAALLQQWKDEIESKTNGLFKVHVHHGKDKLKRISHVKSKDVVITSYQTLLMDFPVPRGTPPEEEAEWLAANGGVLSQVRFYRVIADEAQFIRNRATRASISLAHIKAKHRWMLTGTPVTNTLADIYGLLRFGRFRPWNDWNDFNAHVAKVQCQDALLAGSRAQAILKPILLRRTKNSTLEGKPLLELPTKHIEIVKLQFTPDEREVYEAFERKTMIQVNRFIRNGTLMKNHAFVLVLILRLRQICCHPHLVLSLSDEFEDPTVMVTSKGEQELSRARKIMGTAWVNEIKKKFLLRAASAATLDFEDEGDGVESTCPNCGDMFVGDSGRILACGHEICFDCTLDLSNSAIAHDGIFGQGDERENTAAEKEYENAAAKGYRPCPTCKKMMDLTSPEKVFKASAFRPTDEDMENHKRSEKEKQNPKGKSKAAPSKYIIPDVLSDSDSDDLPEVSDIFNYRKKAKIEPDSDDSSVVMVGKGKAKAKGSYPKIVDVSDSDSEIEIISTGKRRRSPGVDVKSSPDSRNKVKVKEEAGSKAKVRNEGPSDSVVATWRRGDDDLEPSTKMLALVEYLKEWEWTGDKTIIYSQWTSMLDLIEKLFSRHGIRSLRFDGRMDRASRDETLAKFKQPGSPKVFLISTKCGSVGLNLVSANRIINMDLSWNYAAEAQAYDRCHRIGQDKEVHVKRLVVEDTIEERMLRLQDVKMGLAEAALGEGTGAKLHKLSVKDIQYLFGINKDAHPAHKDH